MSVRGLIKKYSLGATASIFLFFLGWVTTKILDSLADEHGWFKNMGARITAISTLFSDVASSAWFQVIGGATVGFTAGVWLDSYLKKREQLFASAAYLTPTEKNSQLRRTDTDPIKRAAVDEIYPLLDEAESLYVNGRAIEEKLRTGLSRNKQDWNAAAFDEFIVELGRLVREIGLKCRRYEQVREIGDFLHGPIDEVQHVFGMLGPANGAIRSLPSSPQPSAMVAQLLAPGSALSTVTEALNLLGRWVTTAKKTFKAMR